MWTEKTKAAALGVSMLALVACGSSPRTAATSGSVPVTTTSSATGFGIVQVIDTVPREQVYRVSVRMDNGAIQTLVLERSPGVQVGDRVRLDNGVIVEHFR